MKHLARYGILIKKCLVGLTTIPKVLSNQQKKLSMRRSNRCRNLTKTHKISIRRFVVGELTIEQLNAIDLLVQGLSVFENLEKSEELGRKGVPFYTKTYKIGSKTFS